MSEPASGRLPVLAVVGRPNVGKSTLVDRDLGRREAVVQDVPGVTRDRVPYDAIWNGRAFTVVDTGGWDPDARGLPERIRRQAEVAVEAADAVLFVVDATVGTTDDDEAVVRVLRRSGRPVVLAANKVDDARTEAEAASMWNLGLGEPYAVSALHGRGSGDLLDAVLAALPDAPPEVDAEPGGPRRVAIVTAQRRQVEPLERAGPRGAGGGRRRRRHDRRPGRRADRARRAAVAVRGHRGRPAPDQEVSGHEYFASLRTQTALERAEVAVVVVDASEPLTEQDQRLIAMVSEAGRAVVVAFNKWDLVDEDRRYYLARERERDLVRVQWAPTVNISALTRWHVDKLVPALDRSLEGWGTRVGTGALNSFLGRLVAEHPHPVRSGKQPKVLFATQAGAAPPQFVLFTSGQLEASYLRFIERRLREDFGFVGTPIHLQQRPRKKRARR